VRGWKAGVRAKAWALGSSMKGRIAPELNSPELMADPRQFRDTVLYGVCDRSLTLIIIML
jgi:hypothetical protein